MQFERKTRLTLLVLIAAVIVIALYLFNGQQDSTQGTAPQQASEPVATLPRSIGTTGKSPEPEDISEADPNDSKSSRVKKERVQVKKPYVPEKVEMPSEIDWEIPEVAQSALESALDGNVYNAIAVSDLIKQCMSGFDSEQQIEARLRSIGSRVSLGNPIPSTFLLGTSEPVRFEDFEAYEDFMWTRFSQCDSTRSIFGQELRERLVLMAESGSVVARYLYAMWLPSAEKSREDQLTAWLVYQTRALEYTWQNINEGQPLGMLAYGQSLVSSQAAYFTARQPNYGQAFLLAAEKCSMNDETLNEKVNNLAEFWNQRKLQYFVQMEQLADEIVDMFCR